MRILIIDDDDIARELLCSTLKRLGHEVHELATAIGATRAIFQHNIDAVVVDVMLPDISGDKLARLLRQNPRGQSYRAVPSTSSGRSRSLLKPMAWCQSPIFEAASKRRSARPINVESSPRGRPNLRRNRAFEPDGSERFS